MKWGDDWSGKNLIQDISLSAIYVQPTLSYKLNDMVSVGAGATIVNGSFEINRAVAAPIGNNNSVNLQGSETAYGFNAGVHIKASEKFNIGLTYRSKVEVELTDGDVDFTVDPSLASSFPDGKFAATLPLVATTTLGFSYQACEKLLVSAEASFVQWGAYESLDFDFENNTASLQDSENARNYEDSYIFRVGAQYEYNEDLDFRVGFYYDQSPIQDEFFNPETPNNDNIGLTCGLSGHITERFGVDASILYIIGTERESEYQPANFGGKYASRAFITGIGFNYAF